MSQSPIPSDEDFARARAAMRHRDRGLSDVRAAVLDRYDAKGVVEFLILYSEDADLFAAYVFFTDEAAKRRGESDGTVGAIEETIAERLEAAGRGARDTLTIVVEVDTQEAVDRDFDGDYFARLN